MIYIFLFIFADSNLSSELSQLTIGSSNKTSSSEKGGSRGTANWGGISGATSAWDTSLACSASSDTSAADSLSASILSGVATERKRNLGLYFYDKMRDTVMKLFLYTKARVEYVVRHLKHFMINGRNENDHGL